MSLDWRKFAFFSSASSIPLPAVDPVDFALTSAKEIGLNHDKAYKDAEKRMIYQSKKGTFIHRRTDRVYSLVERALSIESLPRSRRASLSNMGLTVQGHLPFRRHRRFAAHVESVDLR